ncbi:TetR family transcriptional regulator [Mycobacterium sp. CBMA271]|uniref:TetR/AcrR family transcriptional regulator n=1 Tax=unclassified Mycobacteroides TaxID=2618759 RepID=UPI0013267810|nr:MULTISPECIES: TetR/AcrR family transcriptional regulator [unclassified Mycobacteroides]MUM18266.1 TetR family transcriptional regulator [Mycobacteroides sp. CBMA 326]MUM20853.1 TetR family transcriptional regulator [Mycobacteroides sp. CBMA 271]
MTTEPAAAHRRNPARATRLNREAVVNAALSFLDRAGWDALTINALAVELGTKGPSLYNHVDSLDDLRKEVRDRVLAEIVGMLHTVSSGRTGEDAILAMAGAYRSYARHHPGRYAALTRMPFLDDANGPVIDVRELAKPAIDVIGVYGLNEDTAFHAGVELWAAMHGFVMLEMTGFMGGIEIDPDMAFTEMVHRFASGLAERR